MEGYSLIPRCPSLSIGGMDMEEGRDMTCKIMDHVMYVAEAASIPHGSARRTSTTKHYISLNTSYCN